MLRVPLVTILAQEMRLKFFEVDQRLEMLRVPLVTIMAREMRLEVFQVDQALQMLRVPLVTILAREMRLKIFWSRPSFGDVASAASHDIGARNAIERFFNYISSQTANSDGTSRPRKISLKFVEKMSIFNHIYHANIVTSGPRSTSKACFVEKLSIAFLAPTSWLTALALHSLGGLHVSIAYPAPISWQKRPCSQSHVKHVSVSWLRWHSRQAIVRLSLFAIQWVANFARRFLFLCDWVHSHCHE